MRGLLFCLAALMACGALSPAWAQRVSTYDMTPVRSVDTSDAAARRRAWDEMHAVAALQGIVNRKGPRLYVTLVGDNGKIDRYWLGRLRETGEWLEKAEFSRTESLEHLLAEFRQAVKGVVVWDPQVAATSNVASTVAGADDLLPVRYDLAPGSLYMRLTQDASGPKLPVRRWLIQPDGNPLFTGEGTIPDTRLPSTGSAKCDAYLWAVERYLRSRRCNATRLGNYPDAYWLTRDLHVGTERTLLCNHDYFIAQRGFFFDLDPNDDEAPDDDRAQKPGTDTATLKAILLAAHTAARGKAIMVGGFPPWDQKYTDFTGGRHGGVETEWRYAEILSCYDAFMDADAPALHAMANASLYQHYPLKARYPQWNRPTTASLTVAGWLDASGHVAAKSFVTFYVGDYDSAAWLYQRIPDIWDDPARGSVPMGWAFNPTLAERFPVGLAYTRRRATPNDTFITGDSGAGYLNPGYLEPPRRWSGLPSGLEAWIAHSEPYYKRWDLSLTGFIIDGNAPAMSDAVKKAYARFSPSGVVAQKIPPLSFVDGVPFLRMGPDLTGNPEQGAAAIAANAPKGGPSFSIYRTILWSPSAHRDVVQRLSALRPDVAVVDPYTLMALASRESRVGSRE